MDKVGLFLCTGCDIGKAIDPEPLEELAKESGVDASQLLRFVHGTGRLTNDSLDKIGAVLKLRFVIDE